LLLLVTSSSVAVITAPFPPGHQPGVIGPETPLDPQSPLSRPDHRK
jgi:hypothetical protein